MNKNNRLYSILRQKVQQSFLFFISIMLSFNAVAGNPFDPNKTLFFMGQDTGTLDTWKTEVLDRGSFVYTVNGQQRAISVPQPDGTVAYTGLVYTPDLEQTGPLAGFYQTTNFGAGRVDFTRQMNTFKGALAVGLFLRDNFCDASPEQRAAGEQPELRNLVLRALADDPTVDQGIRDIHLRELDEMINYFKQANRDVLLRIAYEYDGPWNCYTPETFKNAFRAIKNRIDQLGATNIHTVWQSASFPLSVPDPRMAVTHAPDNPNRFDLWYPGDDVVDIVGFSYFVGPNYLDFDKPEGCLTLRNDAGEIIFNPELAIEPLTLYNNILDFARSRGKPAMISESAPAGLDMANSTVRCTVGFRPETEKTLTTDEIWNLWYEDYFAFIRANTDVIKAVTYINTQWDVQPLWSCTADSCSEGYWGDTRLQANVDIMGRFYEEITKPLFKNAPLGGGSFTPPKPNAFNGDRIEAEFAFATPIWEAGDATGGYGLPLVQLNASNESAFIIFANGGSIDFRENIPKGSNIKISYGTVTQSEDPNVPFQFSVYVNGQKVGEVPFVNTGLNFVEANIPADVPPGSVIELVLDSGFVIWFDYIEINNDSAPLPTPDPVATPTPAPATPAPTATPAPPQGGSVFGIDNDGTLFHLDGGQTAGFVFLCVNGDCRNATLEGNRYVRATDNLSPGVDYNIEFKVQDNATGQCIATATLQVGQGTSTSDCFEGGASSPSNTPQPTPAPSATVAPQPTPAPTQAPTPVATPAPNSGAGVFGFDGDTLFHKDGGQTAGFVFLCINGDCRTATLENGRYVRSVANVALDANTTYFLEFKVQDNATGQCIAEANLMPGETVSSSQCAQ